MMRSTEFQPNWASAPGETILDVLRERKLSADKFTQQMELTAADMENLFNGTSAITISIARKLERVLGASVEFWMSRDFQYREDVARLDLSEDEWLADLPLAEMIKFRWLTPAPKAADEFAASLRYFDVTSIREWREKYSQVASSTAFKTSRAFKSHPATIATWLRQGEIEANTIDCQPWNAKKFQQSLIGIRMLSTKKEPGDFIPELQKRCAENGVAVVVVRAPTGCRASGATRFISKEKAIIQLSFRYLSDDHFWFTFFHEAGHLLLHGENKLFLEGRDSIKTPEETEADEFAGGALIPQEFKAALLSLPLKMRDVIRFARRLGISRGIVVGQLQHFGRARRNQLNYLKRRYAWQD